jgi:hypothetical protein
MSEVDLDINNYGYLELLSLFKLPHDYGEKELKDAKKIVLKMHPDKSKLGPEYFLFFSKAYKTIVQIYEFKNKSEKNVEKEGVKEYKELIHVVLKKGDDNSKALKKFIETNDMNDPTKFNKWFNEQFDRLKPDVSGEDKGYGDWYKSDENVSDLDSKTRTKEEIAHEFNKKKQELKSVVKYTGVQEWCASGLGASTLYGAEDASGEYNSDLFASNNNLVYQDLKQAHIESVIPVDNSDYESITKFRTVDDYQRHRDSDRRALAPLSEKEAARLLSEKEKSIEEAATKRAYYYAKQVEENEKKTNLFWAAIKRLSN